MRPEVAAMISKEQDFQKREELFGTYREVLQTQFRYELGGGIPRGWATMMNCVCGWGDWLLSGQPTQAGFDNI